MGEVSVCVWGGGGGGGGRWGGGGGGGGGEMSLKVCCLFTSQVTLLG